MNSGDNVPEKLSPTQLAIKAAESAQASAAAAAKVADAVHEAVVEQAEWRGYMRGYLERQDGINTAIQTFFTNHLPHMTSDIGEVKGSVRAIMWVGGILGSVATAIIAGGILIPLLF